MPRSLREREAEHLMGYDKAPNRGRFLARAAGLAGIAVCLTMAPALAQNVPLPPPRPPSKPAAVTGSVPAKPVPSPQTTQVQPQPQTQPAPNPITNPFAALLGHTGSTVALNPDQRAIIKRVDDYLSNTNVLSGNFVQVAPSGSRSQGEFYIQKPGKVRFDYDPPSPIDIVADGQTVVVRDRRLETQDVYPLSQTPLRFLLSNKVDLMKDTNLVAVYADDVFVTVVVEEKTGIVGTSRLMIMFSAKDMQLKQWTVTDPQGYDTTVAVYNLDTTDKPDPSMFKIDYTNYHN
jgi:outer membrane lipoprotein-sorting protein